jgi:hypothetical protein
MSQEQFTANSARTLVAEAKKAVAIPPLLEQSIRSAAREGKNELWTGFQPEPVRLALKNAGFKVEAGTDPRNESYTKITW